MHFEILVEDLSGERSLEILIPEIIGAENTFKIHSYRGIGRIPRNMKDNQNAKKRILLTQLPKLLKGYGKAFADYPTEYPAAVVLVCDLDNKCLKTFKAELVQILNNCHPQPTTRFCIAIEEGEAWFLGDIPAIKASYPNAKDAVLNNYVNDSICGTWECLADAIFPGGAQSLLKKGGQATGTEKSEWSKRISPHMDVENNASPSFRYFKEKLIELSG
ncbi:MAG: hypothetical protein JKY92_08685 [Magnetovibrio sp.]|nr:hypothetical protein [Magnetovibrio sp.]